MGKRKRRDWEKSMYMRLWQFFNKNPNPSNGEWENFVLSLIPVIEQDIQNVSKLKEEE
jgi:hypothetical protein